MSNQEWLDKWIAEHESDVIALRRDIHAHPEIGRAESRTTALLAARLRQAGLRPEALPTGTGLTCDVGSGSRMIAVRADIDALPLTDTKDVPYKSTVDGMCHACGHDVHTAIVLGVAMALASAPELAGRVRCVFQPAEEVIPGGALDVISAGRMEDVSRILAFHCDPRLPVGKVGIRTGPISAASDSVEVVLSGRGGHTSRPQLTQDIVYALGRIITEVPAMLSRTVDPRSGMSLVWGAVNAGVAYNTIPLRGMVRGTVRVLDPEAWHSAQDHICRLIEQIAAPSGAQVDIHYIRGVPPVVNEAASVDLLRTGIVDVMGESALSDTPQSMGGDDFGWYLDSLPGALARLGVNGGDRTYDLHQGSFDVDERAIGIGIRVMVRSLLAALGE